MKFFENKDVSKIICGSSYTMAICNDGLYGWGNNSFLQLGFCLKTNMIISPEKSCINYDVKNVACLDQFSILVKSFQIKAAIAPVMR